MIPTRWLCFAYQARTLASLSSLSGLLAVMATPTMKVRAAAMPAIGVQRSRRDACMVVLSSTGAILPPAGSQINPEGGMWIDRPHFAPDRGSHAAEGFQPAAHCSF